MKGRALFALIVLTVLTDLALAQPRFLTARDLPTKAPNPDARLPYGEDPLQFGELRIPKGSGPFPVAIFIHGGCWLSRYDLTHVGDAAKAITDVGVATWTLEYRRVGDPGGGWPGTFEDVARGADFLLELANRYPLDLERVIAVGHSAGGHLALWLAAREKLETGSPFASGRRVRIGGVLALAPAPELDMLQRRRVCGGVIDGLMGGSSEEFPDRYRQASPSSLVPLGVPQIIFVGAFDTDWRPVGEAYYEAARAADDRVEMVLAPESSHFEMITPSTTTWPLVIESLRKVLRGLDH